MREAQKVERLRAALPPRSAVRLGVPSELDEPGLVRMQGQIELAEPLSERMQEAFRVPPVLDPTPPVLSLARSAAGPLNLSSNFDQRRRPETLRTAMATAFFWPTSSTRRLPRFTPV